MEGILLAGGVRFGEEHQSFGTPDISQRNRYRKLSPEVLPRHECWLTPNIGKSDFIFSRFWGFHIH